MKDKIVTFVIGILVGAIITTIGFYIYVKVNNNKNTRNPNEGMPQITNFEQRETPPEKPDGEPEENQKTPPEIPSNNTNSKGENL